MDFETLETERDGPLLRVWLNRPERRNAISGTMLREVGDLFRSLETDFETRVVVLGGRGLSFCAGADRKPDPSPPREASTDRARRWLGQRGRRAVTAIQDCEAVTIARIHGHAIGGGACFATACDFRISTIDAAITIPEVDLGIPLAWGGIPRLVREIGPAFTRELVLTCRPFDAHEAKALGFVNRVVPRSELESAVDGLAEQLARKAPSVVSATKRQVNEALEDVASTVGAWADADLLGAAMRDPEARQAARDYLATRTKR